MTPTGVEVWGVLGVKVRIIVLLATKRRSHTSCKQYNLNPFYIYKNLVIDSIVIVSSSTII